MFSLDLSQVALIRKLRPDWQAGKLNGIGGKVEAGEFALSAMVREFAEETGMHTLSDDWTQIGVLIGGDNDDPNRYHVSVFAAQGDLSELRDVTDEPIFIARCPLLTSPEGWHIQAYGDGQEWIAPVISNITWLIPLARETLAKVGEFKQYLVLEIAE